MTRIPARWTPRRPAALALVGLLLVAGCSGETEEPDDSDRPLSAVLITLDTTRADYLACYGGPAGVSPNLDLIASEGVLYENAYTTVPLTLPSHSSMMTGLYPPRHGVRINRGNPLPASAETLAELASSSGYQTAAFVASVVLDDALGLAQGFDTYDAPKRPPTSVNNHLTERSGRDVTDLAIQWLRGRDRDQPFFLWVHYFDPHAPYDPPEAFAKRTAELPYLGEILSADYEIGRLLDVLRADGGIDESLLTIVADHGESLGEHFDPTHGPFCYEATMRVPLLLRYPDGHGAGERVADIASVVDVYPTLADAMRLPYSSEVDGLSLFRKDIPADRGAYLESYYGYLAYGWSPLVGFVDGAGKYLHSSEPRLYEPKKDRLELTDVLASRSADVERYHAGIRRAHAGPRLELAASNGLDPSIEQDISAMGYARVRGDERNLPDPLADSDLPSPESMARDHQATLVAEADLWAVRDYAKSLQLFERLLERNPNHYFALELHAVCLMNLDRHEEALAELTRVVEEGPSWAATRVRLGNCLRILGRDDDAIPQYEAALGLDPGNTEALGNLATILMKAGRVDEAEPYRKRFEKFTGKRLPTAEELKAQKEKSDG